MTDACQRNDFTTASTYQTIKTKNLYFSRLLKNAFCTWQQPSFKLKTWFWQSQNNKNQSQITLVNNETHSLTAIVYIIICWSDILKVLKLVKNQRTHLFDAHKMQQEISFSHFSVSFIDKSVFVKHFARLVTTKTCFLCL